MLSLGLLSACEKQEKSGANAPDPTILSLALKSAVGALKPKAKPVDPRKHLTREAIDKAGTPILFVVSTVEMLMQPSARLVKTGAW